MACGCNGHYYYDGAAAEYPKNYPCSGHTGNAEDGHNFYPGIKGCTTNAAETAGLLRDQALTPTAWGQIIRNGMVVDIQNYNELADAIVTERNRWHKNEAEAVDAQAEKGGSLTNRRFKKLRDQILESEISWTDEAPTWELPPELDDEELPDNRPIRADQFLQLRARVAALQQTCTCNCNYCTCNCNYCTCNCNYSCTCNCNYSDKRLKVDITYF